MRIWEDLKMQWKIMGVIISICLTMTSGCTGRVLMVSGVI